jgi:hypothetical protein
LIRAGDHFICHPGLAHQIENTSGNDLVLFRHRRPPPGRCHHLPCHRQTPPQTGIPLRPRGRRRLLRGGGIETGGRKCPVRF